MRTVFTNRPLARVIADRGRTDVQARFSVPALAGILEQRLQAAEARFTRPDPGPVRGEQLSVELEGEFFASHSFSNINEELARQWSTDESIALTLKRVLQQPTCDAMRPDANRLAPYFGRPLPEAPEVTIRHSFPPRWDPPPGKWVHIQPWEFGFLPKDWVAPLRDRVDEIWAPSSYVRSVYVQSGIPPEKIQVIPWGIDPGVYRPDVPERILPTSKTFRFLFVGGTIARKGFDLVLDAYLHEFSRGEDVCLVIKDLGTQSFYRFGNYRQQVFDAIADPHAPSIIYFNSEMTDGQRASLYTACQCLVAPYRGEGFGLPVLEGMACGLPPIVPRGGPTDDFVPDSTGFMLPARFVPCQHEWELCGEPTELAIEPSDLRRVMRQAFADRQETARRGAAASNHVRANFSWQQAVARMTHRLHEIVGRAPASLPGSANRPSEPGLLPFDSTCPRRLDLAVCVVSQNSAATLANCLARVQPFVKEVLLGDLGSTDQTLPIAREYGVTVMELATTDAATARTTLVSHATAGWIMHLAPDDLLYEDEVAEIGREIAVVRPGLEEIRLSPSRRTVAKSTAVAPARYLLRRTLVAG